MKKLITLKITKEEYEQIAYALHITSRSEAKPPKYYKYNWDFAKLRHQKFNEVDSF